MASPLIFLWGALTGGVAMWAWSYLFGPLTVRQRFMLSRRAIGLIALHVREHADCDVCSKLAAGVPPWKLVQ